MTEQRFPMASPATAHPVRIATLAIALATVLPVGFSPMDARAAATEDRPFAILKGLDKITARTATLEVEVGEVASFGTLQVTVRACRTTPPAEPPESAAFLEIADTPPGGVPSTVFAGWMFASSPALNALDHPVYDIWVQSCADLPPSRTAALLGIEEDRPLPPMDDLQALPPVRPQATPDAR